MDKIISFLFGTGWWSVWYTLLWAAVAPSLALTAWLLRAPALAGQHPGTISTLQAWAIVLHPLIIPASATLFTRSRTTPGVMKYFQGAGLGGAALVRWTLAHVRGLVEHRRFEHAAPRADFEYSSDACGFGNPSWLQSLCNLEIPGALNWN